MVKEIGILKLSSDVTAKDILKLEKTLKKYEYKLVYNLKKGEVKIKKQ